jgi:hypothetical protein
MLSHRSEILARFHRLASHQARSSLNGTHPINRTLKKLKKLLKLSYLSVIQSSISQFSFILTLMHQIISWGQSSCMIKLTAFYSRKLNTAQKQYTTTERHRDLISTIETCKEYKNILIGHYLLIIVFIDHK